MVLLPPLAKKNAITPFSPLAVGATSKSSLSQVRCCLRYQAIAGRLRSLAGGLAKPALGNILQGMNPEKGNYHLELELEEIHNVY